MKMDSTPLIDELAIAQSTWPQNVVGRVLPLLAQQQIAVVHADLVIADSEKNLTNGYESNGEKFSYAKWLSRYEHESWNDFVARCANDMRSFTEEFVPLKPITNPSPFTVAFHLTLYTEEEYGAAERLQQTNDLSHLCNGRNDFAGFKEAFLEWNAEAEKLSGQPPHPDDFPCQDAVNELLDNSLAFLPELSEKEIHALVFLLDKDWSRGNLLISLSNSSASILLLASHASAMDLPDASAQLASKLDTVDAPASERVRLLLRFTENADEYVRRIAVMSLGRMHYAQIDEVVQRLWSYDGVHMKMGCLTALKDANSPALKAYLELAGELQDENLQSFIAKLDA
jgi:hypothetical protein